MKSETVLLTGGTGLIGSELSRQLESLGFEVFLLTRERKLHSGRKSFLWDPGTGYIDSAAISQADYIVHLAGANIGEKRWTSDRKKEITESRVLSGTLLLKEARQSKRLKAFITASGVNYYGTVTTSHIFTESDPAAHDFLGETCKQWEDTAHEFEESGFRSVIIRNAVALSVDGGSLPRIIKPVKHGLGAALGTGRQYFPWIHLDDLCRIYIKAIKENSIHGAYNAVAPEYVTNEMFMKILSETLNKPFILPAVPGIVLKIAFGEMAEIMLKGSRVSSEKIVKEGFTFRYPVLRKALSSLISG
jgi:uncharacterized protein (TIGR01777 family)